MTINEQPKEKQVKLRSRLYPRYDLEDSIKFIESLNKLGGNNISTSALGAEVGKGINNSTFTGRVSSSKQFGLINQDSRRLSVSALGKEILIPRNNTAKSTATTTALSTPDLYKEIIKNFNGKTLPDMTTPGNLLVHDYRIEQAAKDVAARNFIRSATFAGVIQNGILVVSQDENQVPPENQGEVELALGFEGFPPPPPPKGGNGGAVAKGSTFQDDGAGWAVIIKSKNPLNSKVKQKWIEVAELLDQVNAEDGG